MDEEIANCNEVPGKALAQEVPFIAPAPDGLTYLVTATAGRQEIIHIKNDRPAFFEGMVQ